MQNLFDLWSGLDRRRKAIVALATLAVFAAVLAMSVFSARREMALLYAGLEGGGAGEVLAALEQRGAAYEVRGDSIFVEAARRDLLRMELASEGLPAAGAGGYELLDGLTGFGTTAQMFDAAYWRAKEGELARTILATPGVRAARVHIAQPPSQPFGRGAAASAAVTVTMAAGSLSEVQARAFKHLVASAVSGMQPADVSVIDSLKGLVADETAANGLGASAEDRAKTLKDRVQRLLEARVGPNRSVVEVTVELVTDRELINEKTIDPQGRVAISTEMTESSGTSSEGGEGVTVASNLPEGDAGAQAAQSRNQSSESRERINYEVSETARELVREPGAIRRLSVAVLVDGVMAPDADGQKVWQARPDDELVTLRELVASAVGFDSARGDQLTLKSLAFEPLPEQGTLAESGLSLGGFDLLSFAQVLVLGIVAIVLGLFVLRPVLLSRGSNGAPAAPLALPPTTESAMPQVLSGEIQDIGDLPDLPVISGTAHEVEDDPVSRLRRLIDARQAESVQVLRGWLEREEEA